MPPPVAPRGRCARPDMVSLRYGRPRARRRRRELHPAASRGGLLRDELATVRTAEERSRPGWPRCAPRATDAEKSAELLSTALADAAAHRRHAPRAASTACSPGARRRPPPRSSRAAGADPLLAAVRRGLVPARLPRRRPLRRGAGAALPAPPDPADPRAGPRLRHRPLPRRPPRRARARASTRSCTSCSPTEGRRADRYPPRTRDRRTDDPTRPAGAAAPTSSAAGCAFVRRWQRVDRDDPARARGSSSGRSPTGCPSRADRQAPRPRRRAALRRWPSSAASGAFDEDGYAEANRLASRDATRPAPPLRRRGLARPARAQPATSTSGGTRCSYLDPTAEDVNPLLHYLLVGRHEGLAPVPGPPPARTPTALRRRPARRAGPACSRPTTATASSTTTSCDYLRELARYADVFYLADGVLDPGELDKLDGHRRRAPGASRTRRTTSAPGRCWPATWSAGSGSTATTRSCSPTTAASWCARSTTCSPRWTPAPATGGACRPRRWSSTRTTSATDASMPLDEAKRELIGPRRWSDVLYLHLSSYFLVLPPAGPRRRRASATGSTPSAASAPSSSVVDKYEIGISRYLMDSGFDFDTWADGALPVPPAVLAALLRPRRARASRWSSATSSAENPRDVPDFAAWPEWLTAAAPDAPLDLITGQHRPGLARRPDRSAALLHGRGRADRPQGPRPSRRGRAYALPLDATRRQPKLAHWWAFPVAPDTHRLDPGARAVFEVVRDDPTIRKVVLTRSRRFDLDGENVVVAADRARREGQAELARCREILRRPDAARPRSTCRCRRTAHHFVHVGSGLPIGPPRCRAAPRLDAPSSDARRATTGACTRWWRPARPTRWPRRPPRRSSLHQLWLTGLPRHDLVTRACDGLPDDLRAPEQELRDRLGRPPAGRAVAATGSARPHPSTTAERDWLAAWCRRHDVVLGVREGAVDRAGQPDTQTARRRIGAWGSSPRRVPDPSVVLRVADAVVTDDADEAVDFLLTGRPLLHCCRDAADGDGRRAARRTTRRATSCRARCCRRSTS